MTNLYFPAAALAITIFLNIIFSFKKNVNNYETRIFNNLIRLNLIESVIACLIIFLGYKGVSENFLKLLNRVDFTIILFWIWHLFAYIYAIYKEGLIKNSKLLKTTFIINILLTILIFFGKIEIVNNGDAMDSLGLPINTLYISAVAYINLIIFIILKNKNILNTKNIPIYILIILCLFMLIIRRIDPSLLLLSFVISFINLIMYHTIENPDVKLLNELALAKEHAEQANRAKSEFLSSMSHEIRTPLNAIVGFSEIIKTENEPEKVIEDADNIIMASENLLEIVNGILDISKIEANKMEIVNTNYEIMPNLENLAKLIQPRIGEKPIELKTSFAPDLPYKMFGDIGKIKQIITNILTNAVKYTEEGEIDFSVKCINEKDNCTLIISIKDTGRGIKEEKIGTLFQKFQRLDEDRNTTLEGTGLGLAITKSLTELMGGKIVVTSKYGKGSQFTIYINQKIVKLHAGSQEKKINTESINVEYPGARVLIVDDNNLNLKVASKILTSLKIEPTTIISGLESIELIEKGESFDLILMDDMMPRMNGTEALQRLKKIPNFNIPVISLTANAITGVEEKYIKAGFNDYLSKPINKLDLIEKLNKYLIKETNYSNIKVLIVDDNKLNIKVCMSFLKSYNFTINSVLSGKECIEKIKAGEKYDLIFMDDMMPEMSGPETLIELKKISDFKAIVISHTANAVEGAREKYIKAGFDEYIAKPLSKEELKKIIDKLLD